MKLLIFAHKPPPHHGQSYMVQLLLESLGGDAREIQCFHVNSQVSETLEDVGRGRLGKVLLLFKYCAQAIWCRWRYGVRAFYYIPAPPGSRSALFRDWLVMAICRPFFPVMIFHWHAAGLGEWLAQVATPWQRRVTRKLLGEPSLSIVLTEFNRSDAVALGSKRIVVVPNGIPDPCPEFEKKVLPARVGRAHKPVFQVLFIGLCTASKGLFDAVQAIILLDQRLKGEPVQVQLTLAGKFPDQDEQDRFHKLLLEHNRGRTIPLLQHVGFVAGEAKKRIFEESDCLCFPTYYPAESFGLVLVEAMAYGLPVITTRWRSIPELLPSGYSGVVDVQAPPQIADKILELLRQEYDPRLRAHFLANYAVDKFSERMQKALLRVSAE